MGKYGYGHAVTRHRMLGVALPPINVTGGGVLDRVGSTVNWTPWTYSVAGLDTNTTVFVIDDVIQGAGVPSFPYTLADGSTMYAVGYASKAGYASISPTSASVTKPLPNDVTTAEMVWGEFDPTNAAIAPADSRKTYIATAKPPSSEPGNEKRWMFYRGPNANGDLTQLGAMNFNAANGMYEGISGGQNARNATVYCKIAEANPDGVTGRRWASDTQSYQASGNPTVPTGVTIMTGAGLGNIDISLVAGDAQRRPISAPWAVVNGGTPFALSPAGGGAGVRTYNQAGAGAVNVQLFWRNANGDSPMTTAVSVTPGIATVDIATTMQSSVNYDGETFTFADAAPVGTYYGGEPFALTTAPISVTAMGTPSVLVDGTMAHGAMSNAFIRDTNLQGIDGLLAVTTVGDMTPYGGNIDPTAAGAAYAIAANAEDTVTKAKRLVGVTAAHWQKIEKYLPFTFLPPSKRPQAGDFRPGICSTDKVSRLNINTLDFGCCRSLDLTGMGYPTVAVALARWRKAMPYMGRGGESLRPFQVLGHVDNTNYSAQYATGLIGDLGALFHASTTTNAERLQMAAAIAPVAIDIAAQIERGFIGGTGAGQHEFYHPVLAWAAALFNSSYMYSAFQTILSNLDQVYWCEDVSMLGWNTAWPFRNESGENEFVVPFSAQDLGRAVWGGSDGGFPQNFGHGAQLNRTYGDSGGSGKARADTWLPVLFILASRSIPSGPDMLKGGVGAPENNTFSGVSHRSAMLDYIDQEMMIFPRNDSGAATRTQSLWAAHRSLIAVTKKNHVPGALYYSNFVAGANAVTWNYNSVISGNYFSSSPITAQHLYVSQDNVQFKKVPNIAAISSYALPGGIPHWCSLALENAQGEGRRSYTFKHRSQSAADRGLVTPTGVPTGAVTCTDLPVLMRKEFELHAAIPWYVPIAAPVEAGTPIYVGTGFWTGAISGAAAIQMQREITPNAGDAENIIGATSSPFLMAAADTGKRVRAQITRNGVIAYTPWITISAMAAIPAGTIIDTQFGADFKLYYPAFWASLVAESGTTATITHDPFRQWTDLATGDGGLRGIKTGTFPRLTGVLTGLVIGRTYRAQAEIPIEGDGAFWNTNGAFRLGTTKLGFEYHTRTLTYDTTALAQATLAIVDVTFTATATTLWIYSNVGSNTGGGIGGNPALSKLSVKEL